MLQTTKALKTALLHAGWRRLNSNVLACSLKQKSQEQEKRRCCSG